MVAYLLTQTDVDDLADDVIATLATLSTMALTRRQFGDIQARLLECLDRLAEPDVVSMSALAVGRVGRRHPTWVDVGAVQEKLLPLLDNDDRIVRASATLSCGMLRIEAAGEKLAYLWRNDPIKDVREGAHTAMRAVGGEVVEAKLRVEKALSRHIDEFRAELERASYQADMGDMKARVASKRKIEGAVVREAERAATPPAP